MAKSRGLPCSHLYVILVYSTTYPTFTCPLLTSVTLCSSSFVPSHATLSVSPSDFSLHLPFQCNILAFLGSHVFSRNDLRHFPSPRLPSDYLKSMCISYVPRYSMHIYNSLLGMAVLCVFQIQHVQNDAGL